MIVVRISDKVDAFVEQANQLAFMGVNEKSSFDSSKQECEIFMFSWNLIIYVQMSLIRQPR